MKHERITVDPRVMVGKPCIKVTRITVGHVLRELAGGMSIEDYLLGHPHLTRSDILAALAYAADLVENEMIELAPPR